MALKSLETGDTITSQITVTNGFHDGGVGTLLGSNYTTSSLSSTQKNKSWTFGHPKHLSSTNKKSWGQVVFPFGCVRANLLLFF